MKTCSRCKTNKPLTEFFVEKRRNRPLSVCKACGVIKAREYRMRNPDFEKRRYQREKNKVRERHLIRKYGITLADYDRILKFQHSSCAICGSHESEQFNKVFHVDHCHTTGRVRGLLCRGCNHILGTVGDNPEILISAIRYLVPQVAAEFIGAWMEITEAAE